MKLKYREFKSSFIKKVELQRLSLCVNKNWQKVYDARDAYYASEKKQDGDAP